MNGWTDVRHKLPELGRSVLVWIPSRPALGSCPARFAAVMHRRELPRWEREKKELGATWRWECWGYGSALPYMVRFWRPIEAPPPDAF